VAPTHTERLVPKALFERVEYISRTKLTEQFKSLQQNDPAVFEENSCFKSSAGCIQCIWNAYKMFPCIVFAALPPFFSSIFINTIAQTKNLLLSERIISRNADEYDLMGRDVVQRFTDVPQECIASIFRIEE
jgi:hypothetical protein